MKTKSFASVFLSAILISLATLSGITITNVGFLEVKAQTVHDVAVTNVISAKTVVASGTSADVNVTVANVGDFSEIFNVTLYRLGTPRHIKLTGSFSLGWNNTNPGPAIAVDMGDTIFLTLTSTDGLTHQFYVDYNGDHVPSAGEPTSPSFTGTILFVFVVNTAGSFTYYCSIHPTTMHGTFTVNPTPTTSKISSQTVSPALAPSQNRTMVFKWNTTAVVQGNYTLEAVADTVANETNVGNNSLTDGNLLVSIIGDVDGNFQVSILDVVKITGAYATKRGEPSFKPNSDINNDGQITILDVVLCTGHYGEKYP